MSLALLVAFVLTVAAQRDAPPPSASAVISGRVTEQGSGKPLAGIIVTLGTADASRVIEEITDDDGRFEFTGAVPGTYGLWARPDEHRSTHLPQAFGAARPLEFVGSPPRRGIDVKSGERLTGLDIALTRALGIDGRVTDHWDEPMANIDVIATRVDHPGIAFATATTDDRGAYRLFGLVPGTYVVCATPPAYYIFPSDGTARYTRTCHPAALATSHATDVILSGADVANIDIRVQVRQVYTVTGSVVDAAGAPVTGASVSVVPLDEGSASDSTKSARGNFQLGGVMPGRYIIFASIGELETPGAPTPPLSRETGYVPIEVISGDVNGLALSMSRDATIAGRIEFDGTPTPSTRQLRVVLRPRRLGRLAWRGDGPPAAAVDERLNFVLRGLDRLPVTIDVDGVPDGWAVKSIQHDGRDIRGATIDFTSGSGSSPLVVVLTNRIAEPSIVAIDARGNQADDFHVVLFPTDRAKWTSGWFSRFTPGPTIKLGAIAPGDYLVAAVSGLDFAQLSRNPDRMADLAASATPMTFAEGDRRTHDLRLSAAPPGR